MKRRKAIAKVPGYKKRERWKHQHPLFPFQYRRVKPMIKINKYHCGKCGGDVVTREDRSQLPTEFTTPFLIECRATEECTGQMQSAMYRDCDKLVPTFEWRRARPEELKNVNPNRRAFLAAGNPSLFKINPATFAKSIELAEV
jgi:hypothetical protein